MFRQVDTASHDVLVHAPTLPVRPGDREHWPLADGVVPDGEVPLFALVRSTHGLPRDDRRWWPERAARRRDRTSLEVPVDGGQLTPGRHTLVVDGVDPASPELSSPTLTLLERALAGLRSWDALSPR